MIFTCLDLDYAWVLIMYLLDLAGINLSKELLYLNDIICYKKDPIQSNWKIALPESMVVDTVKWFHQVMGYPGKKRL
jgi:hypothetical protein